MFKKVPTQLGLSLLKPKVGQSIIYTGHLKYESMTETCLLKFIKTTITAHAIDGKQFCVYIDPVCSLRTHLKAPFNENNLTKIQKAFHVK